MDKPIELPGIEGFPLEDQSMIGTLLTRLLGGFSRRQVEMLDGLYAQDADWVNAFGSVKKGNYQIISYLSGLFADPNFNAGRVTAPPVNAARRLSDEVVAVSSHLQIAGQGLVGGGLIDLRDNHSLRVLQKQPNGQWLIVSEMYMDARTDWSYIGHS